MPTRIPNRGSGGRSCDLTVRPGVPVPPCAEAQLAPSPSPGMRSIQLSQTTLPATDTTVATPVIMPALTPAFAADLSAACRPNASQEEIDRVLHAREALVRAGQRLQEDVAAGMDMEPGQREVNTTLMDAMQGAVQLMTPEMREFVHRISAPGAVSEPQVSPVEALQRYLTSTQSLAQQQSMQPLISPPYVVEEAEPLTGINDPRLHDLVPRPVLPASRLNTQRRRCRQRSQNEIVPVVRTPHDVLRSIMDVGDGSLYSTVLLSGGASEFIAFSYCVGGLISGSDGVSASQLHTNMRVANQLVDETMSMMQLSWHIPPIANASYQRDHQPYSITFEDLAEFVWNTVVRFYCGGDRPFVEFLPSTYRVVWSGTGASQIVHLSYPVDLGRLERFWLSVNWPGRRPSFKKVDVKIPIVFQIKGTRGRRVQ